MWRIFGADETMAVAAAVVVLVVLWRWLMVRHSGEIIGEELS